MPSDAATISQPGRDAAVCDALAQALIDDPFYHTVSAAAATKPQQLSLLHAYFDAALTEARAVGEVHLSGEDGAALWLNGAGMSGDAQAHAARRKDTMRQQLGADGVDAYQTMARNMAANLPDAARPAWYLSVLGVRPSAQGNGLAGHLLAPTLSRADAADRACYLETFNPRSLPFYQRHGFAPIAHPTEALTGAPYWVLLRPPQRQRTPE